jgi:hypothetical protein
MMDDGDFIDTTNRLMLAAELLVAQAEAEERSDYDLAQLRVDARQVALWAMSIRADQEYRATMLAHVAEETAALTRIAAALERLPAASLAALKAEFDDAPTGAGKTSPAETFRGLREEFGQYYDDVELLE